MKITKQYLTQIIKEELSAILREDENNPESSQELSFDEIMERYKNKGIEFYKELENEQIGNRNSVESIKGAFEDKDKKELEELLKDQEELLEKVMNSENEEMIRNYLTSTKAIYELVNEFDEGTEESNKEGKYL